MMAKIKTQENTAGAAAGMGIPGVGSGILHPTLMNKWRVIFGEGNRYALISMQATKLKFDMVTQTFELWVEQPSGEAQRLLNLIRELASSNFSTSFSVDLLDGNEGITGQLSGFIEMKSHELCLDYAESAIATHYMTFKYRPNSIQ